MTRCPQAGGHYRVLLAQGVLDERGVVMGALAVERARGSGSRLAPWIAALPQEWVWCDMCGVRACVLGVG